MCLAVITARHPAYSFILLSNRDEVLERSTAVAQWWAPPHDHVLGGRDLERPAQGTWLGITKQGRIALLTNFREENVDPAARSRGEIAKSYLVRPADTTETPKQFAKRLGETEGVQHVGGFSLIFGELRKEKATGKRGPLGVISNRTPDADSVTWVVGADSGTQAWTCALSNSLYGDTEWPKVKQAQTLLNAAVKQSVDANESEDELLGRFFDLLKTDTLPKRQAGEPAQVFVRKLRESIFIPAFDTSDHPSSRSDDGTKDGQASPEAHKYGTQKQTVILVDHAGNVRFVERTLYDSEGRQLDPSEQTREFAFQINA